MKLFHRLFLTIIVVLIIMSVIGLIAIQWTLFKKYYFSFSPEGINNYLNAFGEFKALFTATVATVAAYLGLLRLKAATDANYDKLKQDRFSEWKTVLDIRFIEIDGTDPYMRREFTRIRYNVFKQLYEFNFSMLNKTQLTELFETHFKDLVVFFEEQNNRHLEMGGIYPDDTYSYSFNSFRFLLLGSIDNHYSEVVSDLKSLYLASMSEDRFIDRETYRSAKLQYRDNLKKNNKK